MELTSGKAAAELVEVRLTGRLTSNVKVYPYLQAEAFLDICWVEAYRYLEGLSLRNINASQYTLAWPIIAVTMSSHTVRFLIPQKSFQLDAFRDKHQPDK